MTRCRTRSTRFDGVWVSNFLLPLYFTAVPEEGGRNDFLGRVHKQKTLQSFGINPGGYIGFYNPETGDDETFALRNDRRAVERLEVKSKARLTRRSMRYKLGMTYCDAVAEASTAGVATVVPGRRRGARAAAGVAAAPGIGIGMPATRRRRPLPVEQIDSSRARQRN